MKRRIILLTAPIIIFGCIALFCYSTLMLFPRRVNTTMSEYIAHAGGMIDRAKYTNSIEAVKESLQNGIKYIELDIQVTPDKHIIALHAYDSIPTSMPYDFFRKYKVQGKYSTIVDYQIDSILLSNPDLTLVLDKTTDFDIIDNRFHKFKDQIIIECFSFEDYHKYKMAGYKLAMMSGKATGRQQLRYFINSVKNRWDDHFISCFVMSVDEYFDGIKLNPLKRLVNTNYALYTCLGRLEADGLFKEDDRIILIYVDNTEEFNHEQNH